MAAANRHTYTCTCAMQSRLCGARSGLPQLCNLITEIILMNVHNMTILAKFCHVKLNKKVSIYMEDM